MEAMHERHQNRAVTVAVIIFLGFVFWVGTILSASAEDASEPPLAPLMNVLDKAGLAKPLSKAGINIYGYIEEGFMHDFNAPHKGGATFIGYNSFKNSGVLDKVSLNVERTVDPAKKQFDLGFHLEGIYGADTAFMHTNGMWTKQGGHYQGDLLQAYLDVAIPGLPAKIRVGKWIELAGFEQFSANIYGAFGDPSRALYSYSYQYLYAEPCTQTGALATYVLNPQWTFDAGITRGWNQGLRDSNDVSDFLGRVTYTPSDKTTFIFVMTEGPEYPIFVGNNMPAGDNRDWWTALDFVAVQKVNDKLDLGMGLDYVRTQHIPGLSDGPKTWGGVAGYASYAFDPYFTLNSRLEWYRDSADGFSTGAPSRGTYFEATEGVAIKPFPKDKNLSHLLLRPEIRYDRADHPFYNSQRNNQLTFSVDALVTF